MYDAGVLVERLTPILEALERIPLCKLNLCAHPIY